MGVEIGATCQSLIAVEARKGSRFAGVNGPKSKGSLGLVDVVNGNVIGESTNIR